MAPAMHSPSKPELPNAWAALRTLLNSWAYAAVDQRDLRLDLLRGLAVFAMIVDHWGGPSWLYFITGGNTFFVSAAEAFVFISGLVVGMVYGRIANTQGLKTATRKALSRAFTLYKLTVVLTFIFAVVSVYADFGWSRDLDLTDVPLFVFNVATMHEAMFLTDIPLIYTFLMIAAPIGLWLLTRKHTRLLLLLSMGLWLAVQIYPNEVILPWQIVNGGTFDLAAWQLLFFVGTAIGYHRDELTNQLNRIPRAPYFILVSLLLAWLVQIYLTNIDWLASIFPGTDPQKFLTDFTDKTTLAPGRLIAAIIVFQFAYLLVTIFWQPVKKLGGWLLLPLGSNALYSYTMHVAWIALLATTIPRLPSDIMSLDYVNTLVQLSGVFAIWFMIHNKILFRIVPR